MGSDDIFKTGKHLLKALNSSSTDRKTYLMETAELSRKFLGFALLRALAMIGMIVLSARASADKIQYLAHSESSLQHYVSVIRSAKQSIDLTYFIFEPCHDSTKLIVEELSKKAASGVRVRILLDGFVQKTETRSLYSGALRKAGIDIRYYNPNYVIVSPLGNHRSHLKLMIVDSKKYITGGRNIGDEYFALTQRNFIDRDVLVEGASAKQAAQAFNAIWKNPIVKSVAGPRNQHELDFFRSSCLVCGKRCQALKARLKNLPRSSLPTASCASVRFVVDDPLFNRYPQREQGQNAKETYIGERRWAYKHSSRHFIDLLNRVQSSLIGENWAYLPIDKIESKFNELSRAGKKVQIVVNRTPDNNLMTPLQHHFIQRDSHGSCSIVPVDHRRSMNDRWNFTPGSAVWRIHSKVYVADRRDTFVGSFNIDPRSYALNLEGGMFAYNCPQLAKIVLKSTDELLRFHANDSRHPSTPLPKWSAVDLMKSWAVFDML